MSNTVLFNDTENQIFPKINPIWFTGQQTDIKFAQEFNQNIFNTLIDSNPLEFVDDKLTFDPKAFIENKPYALSQNGKIMVVIKKNGKMITYFINIK